MIFRTQNEVIDLSVDLHTRKVTGFLAFVPVKLSLSKRASRMRLLVSLHALCQQQDETC